MNNKKSSAIRPADAAKGAAAERRFQDWLSASEVTHLYIEQSPLSMPSHLRGKFKRADNLVGVPGVGILAFDVKAKTIYPDEGLIFDLDEVKRLRVFARQLHLTVFFACLDPKKPTASYWVRLDQLDFARVTTRAGKPTVACPLDRALFVDMAFNFRDAFQAAVDQI